MTSSFPQASRNRQLNYPMRIVHPERSEGSLCQRRSTTNCPAPHLLSLYFQSLPTIKFCNSFVLITIQIAPGWGVVPIFQFRSSNFQSARECANSYPRLGSLCYNRAAVNFTANPKFAADSQAAKACDSVPSQAGQVPELLDKQWGNEDPSRYCPVCSQRLESRRCKLICSVCGYYMSCTDYY